MKPTLYLAFVIFFLFIGIAIYNQGTKKIQERETVAPCEDTQTFQDIKNTNNIDNLIIEKCIDNKK